MSASVLVVDDSLTVRMNLVEILEAEGMAVTACASVATARAALAQGHFALAILDVLLPDGDGVALLQEIRTLPQAAGTAAMMLSTEAEIRDRVRAVGTSADDYVGKPYDPGYLVERARELVGRALAAAAETILVIDDSLTFREALKATLLQAGYGVLLAASGEEGLRVAAEGRPTALVIDGQLPGIDGATVIRRIRLDSALRKLPCLLLTASEERGAEVQALDAGADAFVHKGEDSAIVLAKLGAMLRSAGSRNLEQAPPSLHGRRHVLAVDDSETYLQALAADLRQEGYEVSLVRSGEEALEFLAREPVDCVLLDMVMPGIGGRETCRRVKAVPILRDIPIVILTGLEDSAAMIEGLAAGADDYIAKSSEFGLLRARLQAQIRRKRFEDENRLIREELLRKELEASEARTAQAIAEARAELVEELELKNEELESFSYSVAHDLRSPLRAIDGFSLALLEDYADKLDEAGRQYLGYVRESAQQMAQLIDDLLTLSRVARSEFQREPIDLADIARRVARRLGGLMPERKVELVVPDELPAQGDERLMTVVFENLLGNAWKFTGKCTSPRVEIGMVPGDPPSFFVRDNGAGFDMAYANKLFGVFQRLHAASEFEGTGIGLATVQRVIRRHGGRIWAEGAVGQGACFSFTLEGVAARLAGGHP
jgi:two-component system, NtrC family, sensor kinase